MSWSLKNKKIVVNKFKRHIPISGLRQLLAVTKKTISREEMTRTDDGQSIMDTSIYLPFLLNHNIYFRATVDITTHSQI